MIHFTISLTNMPQRDKNRHVFHKKVSQNKKCTIFALPLGPVA